jgi:TolB-like protein
VLALIAGYAILQRDQAPTETETIATELKRIAILPFENVGPPDEAYIAGGITDEIRTRLSGLTGLAVIGRQSSIQYRETEKTAQQIGEELRADFLLGGTISIRQSAGAVIVRVRPQLVNATDATQQWAEVYDGEAGTFWAAVLPARKLPDLT